MPCKLVKDGKAKVVFRTPFTIKLPYDSLEYTQPLAIGIDPGSGIFGTGFVYNKSYCTQ